MALEAGILVGHYEVVSSLGAGGMGEVYRARDRELGREVAIKLLPSELAEEPERLARFEREAKVLAGLNHPNIATLYSFEADAGRRFLVMEVVEGETLADRIQRGPLPIDEALPLFEHIARGLEAAHARGVVHRDLKPANIKIARDGAPKILDFGLAKAMAPESDAADPALSQSPTLTLAATQRGVILGTAAYMSPEQASGKASDKRADIWAFGVCLYEALTGRRAFQGEDAPNTLAAVLRDEVDFAALPAGCPSAVHRLLRRCLVRDRRRRLHDIADARLELEEAIAAPLEPALQGTTSGKRLWAIASAAVLVGVLAGWFVHRWSAEPPQVVARRPVHVRTPDLEYPHSQNLSLDISPDGRNLVHVLLRGDRPQLYLQSLDLPGEVHAIPGTDFAANPFFSPDGEWIGFVDTTGGRMLKTPVAGGVPLEILDSLDAFNFRGAGWGEDGWIYFSPLSGGIWKVAAAGGEAEQVTQPPGDGFEMFHWWPFVLPENRGLLYGTCCSGMKVMALDFATGEAKVLVENGSVPRYAASGHLLFVRANRLMAARLDLASLEVGAQAVVVEGLVIGDDRHAEYAIARQGSLAYLSGTSNYERRLARIDRASGAMTLLDREPFPYSLRFDLNPAQTHVALTLWDERADVYTFDLARGGLDLVTEHPTNDYWPVWSRDGQAVTFGSFRSGSNDLWERRVGSNEPAKVVVSSEYHKWAYDRGPDGELLYVQFEPQTKHDIYILERAGEEPRPLVQTPFTEGDPQFSPDGRLFVYGSDRTGQMEVYVERIDGSDALCRVSSGGGRLPRWASSGEIYYSRGSTAIVARYDPATGCEPSTEDLFEGLDQLFWDVSDDGSFFITFEPRQPPRLNVVLDLFSSLD